MARRERQTCSQRPVRSEQRRQTAQGALALRVAPLLFASPALLVSRRPLRVSSSSRLGETKNRQQRGMVAHFNRLLTETLFRGQSLRKPRSELRHWLRFQRHGSTIEANRFFVERF